LEKAVASALKDPDVRAQMNGVGMRPSYLPGAELAKAMAVDAAAWAAVIRESGIKPE
jgi:tripartite-type tricarboxylate transporter receptor subunit TctC